MCGRGMEGKEARVCVSVCMCMRAELGSGSTKEANVREGTNEGMCSLSDAGGRVQGKRGKQVFANLSRGADAKAKAYFLGIAQFIRIYLLLHARSKATTGEI